MRLLPQTLWHLVLIGALLIGAPQAASRSVMAAAPRVVVGNVVPDGSFEQKGVGWQSCGGITFADAQANLPAKRLRVHNGRYAAQFISPTIEEGAGACPDGGYERAHQLIRVPVQIPATAEVVTVSFWYSRIGPENTGDVGVFFSDQTDFIIEDGTGFRLDNISQDEGIGWHEFRQILRGDDLANARKTQADIDAQRPPSGNTYLNIRLQRSLTPDQVLGLFIDDVAVTFSDRSLQPLPLPAALAGDATQPIVYMHPVPNEDAFAVQRMDTDGQHGQIIYRTRLLGVSKPRWSPDGRRIVVVEDDLQGYNPTDASVNPAIVNELTVLDADGRPLAAPVRALGKPGVVGSPPGCSITTSPYCARPEDDAIDSSIYNADWSPNSDALVIELGFGSRNSLGQRGDDINALLLVTAQTAFLASGLDTQRMINKGGAEPSWGVNNSILFRESSTGIYQDTPEIKLDNAKLLVANLGGIIGARQDTFPTWSRDATQFVTIRRVGGGSTFYGNQAIMLHDPINNENDRTLVVVDYPRKIINKPTWSPDGKYVLFTVQTPTDKPDRVTANIWWVDVATGDAGQITNDGQSLSPDWRPQRGTSVPAGQAPGGGRDATVPHGGFGSVRNHSVFLPLVLRR